MIRGKVRKFHENVDTDAIYPARYLVYFEPEEVVKHVMEDLDPDFARRIKPGDVIVAGENFGCGSAREQAAMTLKYAQIGAVVANSICRTFYRNAINNALPVLALPGISEQFSEGDDLGYNFENGLLINYTTGREWRTEPLTGLILDIFKVGGAIAYYGKGTNT